MNYIYILLCHIMPKRMLYFAVLKAYGICATSEKWKETDSITLSEFMVALETRIKG